MNNRTLLTKEILQIFSSSSYELDSDVYVI